MAFVKRLVGTDDDWSLVVLRVVLGVVMAAHGLQKLGVVPGWSLEGALAFFTDFIGVPAAFGWALMVFEVVAGAALIVGLLSRVAAFGSAVIMVGAVLLVHLPVGFFMNWGGTLQGEGYEFHLAVLAIALAVIIKGSGAWSLDRRLLTPAAGAR